MSRLKRKIINLIENGIPTTKGTMAKRIVWFSLLFMAFYAIIGLLLLSKGISLDSTLTTCVYTTFGTELCLLMIKRLFNPKDGKTEESGINTEERI